MIRLAHLSDIHISSVSQTLTHMWTSKRLLGGANMLLRRRRELINDLLPVVVEHIQQQQLDHVIVTGDFSTTALDKEFEGARQVLLPFIEENRLTAIPGNHDLYTQGSVKKQVYERFFQDCHGVTEAGSVYPHVRHLDENIALIGVNTCLATGLFQAWGEVDPAQLQRLKTILKREEGRMRIVLLHHYFQDRKGTEGHHARNLHNRTEVMKLLKECGADMVLHGHEHARYRYTIPGPDGEIPVFNPGPTTRRGHKPEHWGGYLEYGVEDGVLKSITSWTMNPHERTFSAESWDI